MRTYRLSFDQPGSAVGSAFLKYSDDAEDEFMPDKEPRIDKLIPTSGLEMVGGAYASKVQTSKP